ncbi:hypothetical protein PINS_up020851 [Pythium insidiosum]|nr:hypothetical protein PINS_up020851 [Pythium insidiosum]
MESEEVASAVAEAQRALESVVQAAHDALAIALEDVVIANRSTPERILRSVFSALAVHEESIKNQVRDCAATQLRETLAVVQHVLSTEQLSTVEQVVNLAFGDEDGLVNWMEDPQSRDNASAILAEFKLYTLAKRGNDCRSQFDLLLPIYMRELGMTPPIPEWPSARIAALQAHLLPSNSYDGDTQSKVQRHRIIWACNGIRNVGNERSHASGDLSDDEILEICASVRALSRSLAPVAQSLRADIISESENLTNASTTPATIVTSRPSVSEVTASTNGSPGNSSSGNGSPGNGSPGTSERRNSGWLTAVATTSASAPPVVNGNGTSAPYRPRIDTSRFHFFYNRPVDLPEWPPHNKMKFARMLNHMRLVPRANLCDGRCDRSRCRKSHSYLEVMRYNPLFKVIKCGKPEHYWAHQVQEPVNCVCAHVDVEVDMEAITSEKNQLCRSYVSGCGNDRCCKSHSFEEICWYNPLYKTKECDHGARCVRDETCCFFHNENDKREVRTEDDYVGREVAIPHIERTHSDLARKLDALRAAGSL